jgi:hypothetical protein
MFLAYCAVVAAMTLPDPKSQALTLEVVYASWKEKDQIANGILPRKFEPVSAVNLSIKDVGESVSGGKWRELTEIRVEASVKERTRDHVRAIVSTRAKTMARSRDDGLPLISTFSESEVVLDMGKWTLFAADESGGTVRGFLIRILDSRTPKQ